MPLYGMATLDTNDFHVFPFANMNMPGADSRA